jgi:hypothetical protein
MIEAANITDAEFRPASASLIYQDRRYQSRRFEKVLLMGRLGQAAAGSIESGFFWPGARRQRHSTPTNDRRWWIC